MPPIPLPPALVAQPPFLHPTQQYEVILRLSPVMANNLRDPDNTAPIFLNPQQDPTIITITPTQVSLHPHQLPATDPPPPKAADLKPRQALIPTTITLTPTLTPSPAPTFTRTISQAPPPTITVAQPPPPYIPPIRHHSLGIGSIIGIILGSLASLLLLLSLLRYLAYRRRRQPQITQPPLPSYYREEDYYKSSPRRSPSPYRHHHRRHHKHRRRDEPRGRRSSKTSYDYAEVPVMRTVPVVHTRTVPQTTTTTTRTIPVQQTTTTETRPGDLRGPTNVYYR